MFGSEWGLRVRTEITQYMQGGGLWMHKWDIGFLIKEVSILSIIKARFLTAREGHYKFGKGENENTHCGFRLTMNPKSHHTPIVLNT